MIRIRFSERVATPLLHAMHESRLPEQDGAVSALLREAGVVSIRPVHNLSQAEVSLGLAAARDFYLDVAPGADEWQSVRLFRESPLVEDVSAAAPTEAVSPLPGALPAAPAMGPAAAMELAYAGFWLRFAALFIDAIVVTTAWGFLLGFVRVMPGLAAFALVALPVGPLAYYAVLESSTLQATLGKLAVGIIVVDMKGRRLTVGRALGRNAAKVLTAWVPLGAGWMMAGFTEKKQALHDLIASTLVVRKSR